MAKSKRRIDIATSQAPIKKAALMRQIKEQLALEHPQDLFEHGETITIRIDTKGGGNKGPDCEK
jgi:hypothetical protein